VRSAPRSIAEPAPYRLTRARREASAARRAAEAADERSEAVTAVLVRKAQEKQTADVNAFQMQQRAAVAATVKAQRLAKEAKDKASHAVGHSAPGQHHLVALALTRCPHAGAA